MSWRQTAEPIIANVLAEHKGSDEKTLRKALHDAYPFGQRRYHPYKIWLNEIRRQRGIGSKAGCASASEKLKQWEELYGRREA